MVARYEYLFSLRFPWRQGQDGVAAADTGVVAFLSEDGSWPVSPMVQAAAHRLGVTIVRFDFGNFPQEVRDRLPYIEHVRYQRV